MKTHHHLLWRITAVAIALLLNLFPSAPDASAGVPGFTWLGPTAADGNWNNGLNWTGGVAPNSTVAQATFPTSPTSAFNPIFLSTFINVAQITFAPGADPLTISTNGHGLILWGAGIINNSGHTQTIVNPTAGSYVEFFNTASAGLVTIINQDPGSWIDISHLTSSGTTLGAVAGNGTIYLGSKNLAVGGNNLSTVFSGVIRDGAGAIGGEGEGPPQPLTGGSLTKIGTGTLNLTGANIYTGNTTVNGGKLLINGSIVSPMTFVNAGGTLGGSGLIGGAVVNNGGTVSPGNSPGTLNIKGNYTQGANGTLLIEIASTSVFDRIIMGGRATLGGTLNLETLNGFQLKRGETFDFLSAAGGINGTFSSFLQPDTGTILKFKLVYEGNDILLEAAIASFSQTLKNLTPNQTSVAKELDRVANDNRAGKLMNYLTAEPLGQLPNDFDKIAAEEYTSIFTLGTSFDNVQSLNLQRRTDDVRSGAGGFSAAGFHTAGTGPSYSGAFGLAGPNGDDGKETKEMKTVAPEEKRWGAFITGIGEWVGVSDDYNARGYDIETGGFTLGVDYKVCSHFAVGLLAGYVGTGVDLNDGGRVLVNGGKLGLYATAFGDGLYADMGVTGGYSSYDVHRSALQGTARGDTDGGDLNVLFGAGYDIKMGGFTFGPTGTFNYTYVGVRDFTETGSLAPLHFPSQGQESVRTAFGAKASYECKCGNVIVKPELRAAWQHEYGDAAYEIDSSFASGAGNIFTVNGPRLGRDSLLVGAGFAIQWNDRCSSYVYYDGELGATRYNSQNVSGGCRLAF